MQEKYDIVIIGAGPASSSAAIHAAKYGLRTCIVERTPFPRSRPGETLHPGIEPLFKQLGVWDTITNAQFIRHPGIWVTWNSAPEFQPFNPTDSNEQWLGLQAYRRTLDSLLLDQAKQLGVKIYMGYSAEKAIVNDKRVLGIVTDNQSLFSSYVIDASGSWHWLARQLAISLQQHSPKLLARYGYVTGTCPDRDAAPAIIADPDGWTWMAKVGQQLYQWTRLTLQGVLPTADWLPNEFIELTPCGKSKGADVTWRIAEQLAGPGYFLVGDAAAVLDPASSHGVLRAIMSGIRAADLIYPILNNHCTESFATNTYQNWLTDWFKHDTSELRQLYHRLSNDFIANQPEGGDYNLLIELILQVFLLIYIFNHGRFTMVNLNNTHINNCEPEYLNDTHIDTFDKKYQSMLTDLQGNILKSHGRKNTHHIFLHFNKGEEQRARQWIQEFAGEITTALPQIKQAAKRKISLRLFNLPQASEIFDGGIFVNFMLSAEGYRALGCKEDGLPEDKQFRAGMQSSRKILADNPCEWEDPFKNDEIHALIILADDDEHHKQRLQKRRKKLEQEIQEFAKIIHEDIGIKLVDPQGRAIEHFGYADGISQPLFLKDDSQHSTDQWDAAEPLNLVLVKDKLGDSIDSLGTYVVYRKLKQDVQEFNKKVRELASELKVLPDLAGAYVVGRFKDGTPVVLSSNSQQKPIGDNDFDYANDKRGTRCPLHAHIRKTNPRGETSSDIERSHRILRRAIPYGERGEEDVGLLFICMQRDIANQFEFMQEKWANNHRFFRGNLGSDDPDPGLDSVIGQQRKGENSQTWPTQHGDEDAKTVNFDFSRFVTNRGGEYFFMPSISFLKNIDLKLSQENDNSHNITP